MAYRAVDRHNMMGGRGFRVEQLKIRFPIPWPNAHRPTIEFHFVFGCESSPISHNVHPWVSQCANAKKGYIRLSKAQ